MADFKNEFSWSKSRAGTFEKCKRSYYLQYYGSWGGWDWSAAPEHKEIYVMKNLQTIPLWVGSVVHEVAEWIIKRVGMGDPIPLEQALAKVQKDMDNDWYTSRTGEYRDKPNEIVGLVEHYYDSGIGQEEYGTAVAKAETCIQNLYQSSIYQDIAGKQILASEQFDSMRVDGIKVWAVPDVVTLDSDALEVIDWKSSKEMGGESVCFQLSIYSAYCAEKWNVPYENIAAHEVNLLLNQIATQRFTSENIQQTKQTIIESASAMLDMLIDTDDNRARKGDFPMTENLKECRSCNFKRACGRE